MRVVPARGGALGAEIFDVDLAQPQGGNAIAAIRQALLEHQVIVFRDQRLTVEQHKAFARNFGPLHVFKFQNAKQLPGHPDVLRVVKEADGRIVFGGQWHADVSFLPKPLLGSLLYALETPARGGDTLFANMYQAYDTLSEGMKELLEGLVAVHESDVPNQGYGADPADYVNLRHEHPVVRVHPETGRKLLFVNKTYVTRLRNMTVEESRPLLEWLFAHATKAEHVWRLSWAPGSLAFWDNRCTQHLPMNDYHGQRREMHRVAVLDEPPPADRGAPAA